MKNNMYVGVALLNSYTKQLLVERFVTSPTNQMTLGIPTCVITDKDDPLLCAWSLVNTLTQLEPEDFHWTNLGPVEWSTCNDKTTIVHLYLADKLSSDHLHLTSSSLQEMPFLNVLQMVQDSNSHLFKDMASMVAVLKVFVQSLCKTIAY